MTEEEWLKCTTPVSLLEFISAANQRKLRAFAIACCRRIAPFIDDPRMIAALDAAEQFVDGATSSDLLTEHHRAVSDSYSDAQYEQAWAAIWCASRAEVGWNVSSHAVQVLEFEKWGSEYSAHCDLIRDIFGSPFCPVTFSPEWLTTTATAIAAQMYQSRDFSAMPILADALQDTGCDNPDVLNHCRDAGATHVRGCWVVDMVLGKS
ncbi:Uncharacterized protein (Fragment) OS=uncultured bacterium PE=4 SV=1 [Gemmata massiliana]|uniref:Uncharacterized protein n=1 Tax=Gemmata massiliana TaxID=1210884 RepID=A0A6P2D798_9BACT